MSYIVRYQQQNLGRSPSQRQIQAELGLSAPSVAHNLLHRLERRALLQISTYGRGYRAELTVTEAGLEAVRGWEARQRGAEERSGEER